jgi:hypothetical protein
MIADSVVRARIEEQTKNEAAAVLKAIRLMVSVAFRLMMVKIAKVGPARPSVSPFWLSAGWLRSNFVAAEPPGTEDYVQTGREPENVGEKFSLSPASGRRGASLQHR